MKIAIIGSGISGLSIAYLLNQHHDVTVFEKNSYIGGHSRTIKINDGLNKIPVDTGFIVFNKRNYPNLTALFDHLNVEIIKSDMSFGVSIANGWFEYGSKNLSDMFLFKRHNLNPSFWKMVVDILKFNKKSMNFLQENENLSMGQFLEKLKLGKWFKNYYLLPMGASIWSTPTKDMLDFPAKTFINFFNNHGLLSVNNHPQWYTVKGGSCEYIKLLTKSFKNKIHLNNSVKTVIRHDNKIKLIFASGQEQIFDQVIFACHSDQALQLLENPSSKELEILGDIKYSPNKIIVHNDLSFMPKNKKAWASWVYLSEKKHDDSEQVCLSYWMNNLQSLDTIKHIIITLNSSRRPDDSLIYDEYNFEHPQFDMNAIKAQEKINQIQGQAGVWYCGAWQKYGFHEDGIASSVAVAKKIGVDIPWS